MKYYMDTVHKHNVKIKDATENLFFGELINPQTNDKEEVGNFLDFWGDEGVNSLGYGHLVWETVQNLIDSNVPFHIPKMYHNDYHEKLSEELLNFTKLDGKVIFSNSGTEANEAAIKLARLHWAKRGLPYRNKIATYRGNFHGRTGFSLAASDSSDSVYHKWGMGPFPSGFRVFHSIKDLYNMARQPNGLAAIIMATVLGNNKIETYSQRFFDDLKRFREETGTLIIFDEVQVGMGRTGKRMAYHHYDIYPDIVTIGKGLAAGMPLTATVTGRNINNFKEGEHFNTVAGNIWACELALKVIKYVEDNLDEINKMGYYIRKELYELPFVSEVVGIGVHNAFQPIWNKDSKIKGGFDFCNRCSRKKLLLATHRDGGQIRFTPPLTIEKLEVDNAIEIMRGIWDESK